jgi:heme oxygenase
MKDMQEHLEKLHRDAAECAIIRDLATDPKKRELFTKLAEHMSVLASEVERAIAKDTDKAAS